MSVAAVVVLVALATVLAVAEAATSRVTAAKAAALEAEGRPGAATLAHVQAHLTTHLNAVYLAVMCVQNGSAILVAYLADRHFGSHAIAAVSFAFTLGYFVLVEAMAKTFGVLHAAPAALALAPFVRGLARVLDRPTRALIWLGNVLLPGKGLPEGPHVSAQEIRSLAQVGHAEGTLDRDEKDLIQTVREIMVPRPDIVAVDAGRTVADVAADLAEHAVSRVPIFRDHVDDIRGFVHAVDVLREVTHGRGDALVETLRRPIRFVPRTKRVVDLLREMHRERFQIAIVTDEYGAVAGMVTLENVLEELVGDIADEHEDPAPPLVALDGQRWRASGALRVRELNDRLGVRLPHDQWDTVGGLLAGVLGRVPETGARASLEGLDFEVESVIGLRVDSVLLTAHEGGERAARSAGDH